MQFFMSSLNKMISCILQVLTIGTNSTGTKIYYLVFCTLCIISKIFYLIEENVHDLLKCSWAIPGKCYLNTVIQLNSAIN